MEEKENRISVEIKRLSKVFVNVSKDKKHLIEKIIIRAAFLLVMIEDLEKELVRVDSFTCTTINASQTFTKSNPLLEEYRKTTKSYQAVIKQLVDLTKSEDSSKEIEDELEAFIRG